MLMSIDPHNLTKDNITTDDDGAEVPSTSYPNDDPSSVESIQIGDWYMVEYEWHRFPGEVVAVESGEF